jgi:hypothetical protein
MTANQVIDLSSFGELAEFQPIAYYDQHMDFIRVCTHDRSVTELRCGDTLTLHACNHRTEFDPRFVGFTIKGIKHLFNELNLPLEGVYPLIEIIDRMVKREPTSQMAIILNLCLDSLEGPLEIDMAA